MGLRQRNAAAFLDRDGVLNEDRGYVGAFEQFRWMPGAPEAVAKLRHAGYLVFVVTNQSGIARGFYDEADVEALHALMQRQLAAFGTGIDAFRYCPHHPDGRVARYCIRCDCRKPAPGLLLSLIETYEVDRSTSFLIGDKATDLDAAAGAGIAGYLFRSGSLVDFVRDILRSR